jgi:hypothetical protein
VYRLAHLPVTFRPIIHQTSQQRDHLILQQVEILAAHAPANSMRRSSTSLLYVMHELREQRVAMILNPCLSLASCCPSRLEAVLYCTLVETKCDVYAKANAKKYSGGLGRAWEPAQVLPDPAFCPEAADLARLKTAPGGVVCTDDRGLGGPGQACPGQRTFADGWVMSYV